MSLKVEFGNPNNTYRSSVFHTPDVTSNLVLNIEAA